MQNTNLAGKQKAPFGLRQIRGIGRRFAIVTLKIAGVNAHKRTGELNEDEIKAVSDIIARPTDYNIPKWFLNRQKAPEMVLTLSSFPTTWTLPCVKISRE